jgi:hypothetical protein
MVFVLGIELFGGNLFCRSVTAAALPLAYSAMLSRSCMLESKMKFTPGRDHQS